MVGRELGLGTKTLVPDLSRALCSAQILFFFLEKIIVPIKASPEKRKANNLSAGKVERKKDPKLLRGTPKKEILLEPEKILETLLARKPRIAIAISKMKAISTGSHLLAGGAFLSNFLS